jgi:hypothetical protein
MTTTRTDDWEERRRPLVKGPHNALSWSSRLGDIATTVEEAFIVGDLGAIANGAAELARLRMALEAWENQMKGQQGAGEMPIVEETMKQSPTDLIVVRVSARRAVLAERYEDHDHYYTALTTPMPIPAAEQARDYYGIISARRFDEFLSSVGAKTLNLEG